MKRLKANRLSHLAYGSEITAEADRQRIKELENFARKQLNDINRLTTELVKEKAANRRKP